VLYDLQTQSFEMLAQLGHSRMNPNTVLPAHLPVTFKSRDGLTLNGYLTLQPGVPKPAPFELGAKLF
jgi:dipeptidyl aminopeptidase/acylaminoacyl peptidase